MSARYRFMVAHDEPQLLGYDQDLWVQRLHADPQEQAAELLAMFTALREANVAMWHRSTEADRARVGLHAERGAESYDLSFRMIAGARPVPSAPGEGRAASRSGGLSSLIRSAACGSPRSSARRWSPPPCSAPRC